MSRAADKKKEYQQKDEILISRAIGDGVLLMTRQNGKLSNAGVTWGDNPGSYNIGVDLGLGSKDPYYGGIRPR